VAEQAATFQLPALSGNQRAILQVALSFVGYPYIWGGTSERPQDPFAHGKQVPGGFDCSGFAWRVYKLQAYTGGEALAATLKGRTTYAMSGEVPRAKRIGLAKLQPGDLLFFGAAARGRRPGDINHMGIYLGAGWFVQASDAGVALSSLSVVGTRSASRGPAAARRSRPRLARIPSRWDELFIAVVAPLVPGTTPWPKPARAVEKLSPSWHTLGCQASAVDKDPFGRKGGLERDVPVLARRARSRFVSAVSSASISTGRVRRGSITSST
jgi:hypothetical protein